MIILSISTKNSCKNFISILTEKFMQIPHHLADRMPNSFSFIILHTQYVSEYIYGNNRNKCYADWVLNGNFNCLIEFYNPVSEVAKKSWIGSIGRTLMKKKIIQYFAPDSLLKCGGRNKIGRHPTLPWVFKGSFTLTSARP